MSEQLLGIKAIIFDLGKVIIDLHYDRTAIQLARLSGLHVSKINLLLESSEMLKMFEVGGMSEDKFRSKVCGLLNIKLEDKEFDTIWNSLLGEISKARLEKMLELKDHFTTLVLSNTNAIHLRSFNETLRAVHGFKGIHELVDAAYYSHEVGMRKPNHDIYQFVLEKLEFAPKEVLFIDDRLDNIKTAREIGMRVFLNEEIDDWLKGLG